MSGSLISQMPYKHPTIQSIIQDQDEVPHRLGKGTPPRSIWEPLKRGSEASVTTNPVTAQTSLTDSRNTVEQATIDAKSQSSLPLWDEDRIISHARGTTLRVPWGCGARKGRESYMGPTFKVGWTPLLSIDSRHKSTPGELPETAALVYQATTSRTRPLGSGLKGTRAALTAGEAIAMMASLGGDMAPQEFSVWEGSGMSRDERVLYLAKADWQSAFEDLEKTEEECHAVRSDFAQCDYAFRQRALKWGIDSGRYPHLDLLPQGVAELAAACQQAYDNDADYRPPRPDEPEVIIDRLMRERYPELSDVDGSIALAALRGQDSSLFENDTISEAPVQQDSGYGSDDGGKAFDGGLTVDTTHDLGGLCLDPSNVIADLALSEPRDSLRPTVGISDLGSRFPDYNAGYLKYPTDVVITKVGMSDVQ